MFYRIILVFGCHIGSIIDSVTSLSTTDIISEYILAIRIRINTTSATQAFIKKYVIGLANDQNKR